MGNIPTTVLFLAKLRALQLLPPVKILLLHHDHPPIPSPYLLTSTPVDFLGNLGLLVGQRVGSSRRYLGIHGSVLVLLHGHRRLPGFPIGHGGQHPRQLFWAGGCMLQGSGRGPPNPAHPLSCTFWHRGLSSWGEG